MRERVKWVTGEESSSWREEHLQRPQGRSPSGRPARPGPVSWGSSLGLDHEGPRAWWANVRTWALKEVKSPWRILQRKDINRCRILQNPSGSSMEKDHSGTGQETAARTEMVRRGRTLDACIWKMESTGFC